MNQHFEQKITEALKKAISAGKGSYIALGALHKAAEGTGPEAPVYLMSPDGRALFRKCIDALVSAGLISPVGRRPGSTDGLYLKYRINKAARQKDDELAKQIIRSIIPPAKLDFYLKNPWLYREDKEIIEKIMGFLKTYHSGNVGLVGGKGLANGSGGSGKNTENWVTVNERSYELFGDEKFLRGAESDRSVGETILRRLGLGFSDIGCNETLEPFFSFMGKAFHIAAVRKVFIIENKDTFWSFKRNAMVPVKGDMLVYGEGRKILSSFQFMEEYNITPGRDEILYFGDLDAEGVNIFCELADKYPPYGIKPFCEGYLAMLEIGTRRGLRKTPKLQRMCAENIDRFCGFFEQPWVERLKALLNEGFYIPQEALSAAEMRERFGTSDHG